MKRLNAQWSEKNHEKNIICRSFSGRYFRSIDVKWSNRFYIFRNKTIKEEIFVRKHIMNIIMSKEIHY